MTAWLSFRRAWGQDVVTRSRRIPRWSVTKVDEDKARRRSARRGLAPLNPFEVTRPKLLTWLECTDEDHRDNSMTMVDDPDQSSHGWPRGLSNAASSNQCADPGRYQSSLGGAERCRDRGHKCRMGPPFALLRRTRPFQPFRITYFVHRCQGVQWERDPFPFQGYWADTETTPTAACDGVLPLA